MRRLIAMVIIGLGVVIAIYHLEKKKDSTNKDSGIHVTHDHIRSVDKIRVISPLFTLLHMIVGDYLDQ